STPRNLVADIAIGRSDQRMIGSSELKMLLQRAPDYQRSPSDPLAAVFRSPDHPMLAIIRCAAASTRRAAILPAPTRYAPRLLSYAAKLWDRSPRSAGR